MKSSFHSQFLSCHYSATANSIQFLCTQAHIPAGWRLETRLHSTRVNWTLLYNYFARTTQKTHPLYCWEGVFTAPLHSKGSYSIVACVFFAEGICLPSYCLTKNLYSDFTILVFGRHITISCSPPDSASHNLQATRSQVNPSRRFGIL
jgi:hypothetical protein